MKNNVKLICTLGPASFKKKILKKLKYHNVHIYRINLSHTKKDDIKKKILYLKKQKIKNICLDTEGAQIRTSNVKNSIFLKKGSLVSISCANKNSGIRNIFLYPVFNINSVPIGSKVLIGFDNLCLKVLKKNNLKKKLICKVNKSGYLQSNKGVHINHPIKLNALTEKDIYALKLGYTMNINHYEISFVNSHKDIDKVKEIVGSKKNIISKIETLNGIKDLRNIAKKSNALLIDRGDLSRYINIEKIPHAQEMIIKNTKSLKKPVYIATNLLENMIEKSQPTRAESNDIYSSLKQGAKGLVLAAETAIGKNPIDCVIFIKKCIKLFNSKKKL